MGGQNRLCLKAWRFCRGICVDLQNLSADLLQQVGDQDFEADADEDESADDFDFVFEEMACAFADFPSGQTDDKGDDADEGDGLVDKRRDQRQGDADDEGVDAGGDAEGQQDAEPGRIVGFLAGFSHLEGFINHLAADKGQQDKGQPVVIRGDIAD